MGLSSKQREALSKRIKKVRDMGGIAAISRHSGLCRFTIYNALKSNKNVRPTSYQRISQAITAIEAQKKAMLAS